MTIMQFMQGKKLKYVKDICRETVKWKQGSFIGFGGDRSQTFTIHEYRMEGDAANGLIVYVSDKYHKENILTVS